MERSGRADKGIQCYVCILSQKLLKYKLSIGSHDSSVGKVTTSEVHDQRTNVRFPGMAIIVLFPQKSRPGLVKAQCNNSLYMAATAHSNGMWKGLWKQCTVHNKNCK